ncbi:MAG: hypothetical protein AAFR67_07760 [Chloroflexota bacterium]
MSEKSKRKNIPPSFASLYLRKRLSMLFPATFMPVFIFVFLATSYAGIDFAPQLGWDLPLIFVALTLFGFLGGHFAGERLQPLIEDNTSGMLDTRITRWSTGISAIWWMATIWKIGGLGAFLCLPIYWLVRKACYSCVDAYASGYNIEKMKTKPKKTKPKNS